MKGVRMMPGAKRVQNSEQKYVDATDQKSLWGPSWDTTEDFVHIYNMLYQPTGPRKGPVAYQILFINRTEK